VIIYLQILFDAIQDWGKNSDRYFEVILPTQAKKKVEEFMLK
jgi:hypothetical protein